MALNCAKFETIRVCSQRENVARKLNFDISEKPKSKSKSVPKPQNKRSSSSSSSNKSPRPSSSNKSPRPPKPATKKQTVKRKKTQAGSDPEVIHPLDSLTRESIATGNRRSPRRISSISLKLPGEEKTPKYFLGDHSQQTLLKDEPHAMDYYETTTLKGGLG